MAKFKGKLTISSPRSSSRADGWVSITLVDESSGREILEVDLEYDEFGKALTGLSYRPCEFEVSSLDLIGKNLETKEEIITYNRDFDRKNDLPARKKALKPFEVDGWQGSPDDLGNWHNSKGNGQWRVGFRRYV